jgi:hypothetical protein
MGRTRAFFVFVAVASISVLLGLHPSSAQPATGPAASRPASPAADEAGFVSMFNGKDFSGWQFGDASYALPTTMPANWKIDSGVIRFLKDAKPNLTSQWDYEDFEARLEWRAMQDNYNSGFYIRSERNSHSNQLNFKKGDEGMLQLPVGKPKGAKPAPELQRPLKEWNQWRVLVVGDKLTLWCNGQLAYEATGVAPARGYIGLQAEYFPIEWRNIRIKEIGCDGLNDLACWTGKGWKLEGDVLTPGDGAEALESKTTDYGDYHLRFEWRQPKEAKGGGIWLRGPKGAKSGFMALGWEESPGLQPAEGGSGAQPVARPPANPRGQWNYCDVMISGGKAIVLNSGASQYEGAAGVVPASGPIGLSPGLEYRNIRITRLPAK